MNKKLFIVALLTFSNIIFSQQVRPSKDTADHKDETVECWRVVIKTPASETRKSMKLFFKENFELNMKSSLFGGNNILESKDVEIPKISSKKINIYTSIVDLDGDSEVKIFGNYGSLYFNNGRLKQEYLATRGILIDFLNYHLPIGFQERINLAEINVSNFVDKEEVIMTKISDNKKRIKDIVNENKELSSQLVGAKKETKLKVHDLSKKQKEYVILKGKLAKVKK